MQQLYTVQYEVEGHAFLFKALGRTVTMGPRSPKTMEEVNEHIKSSMLIGFGFEEEDGTIIFFPPHRISRVIVTPVKA
jgi:hypothetical protein